MTDIELWPVVLLVITKDWEQSTRPIENWLKYDDTSIRTMEHYAIVLKKEGKYTFIFIWICLKKYWENKQEINKNGYT